MYSADRVAEWPAGALDRLMAAGLLRQAENSTWCVCPGCYSGHFGEVFTAPGPDGVERLYMACPEAVSVEVSPELLRQWTIDVEGIGAAVQRALALTGRRTMLYPQRLWRLGRTEWQGAERDMLLLRGARWQDAGILHPVIERQLHPILLVGTELPPLAACHHWPWPVIELSEVAALGDDGLEIDAVEVAQRVADADARNPAAVPIHSARQLRRQVKEQLEHCLLDDQLIAAYREHGSVRKAADALSTQTGRPVTKDDVHRAVNRAGGAATVGGRVRGGGGQRRNGRRLAKRPR